MVRHADLQGKDHLIRQRESINNQMPCSRLLLVLHYLLYKPELKALST